MVHSGSLNQALVFFFFEEEQEEEDDGEANHPSAVVGRTGRYLSKSIQFGFEL